MTSRCSQPCGPGAFRDVPALPGAPAASPAEAPAALAPGRGGRAMLRLWGGGRVLCSRQQRSSAHDRLVRVRCFIRFSVRGISAASWTGSHRRCDSASPSPGRGVRSDLEKRTLCSVAPLLFGSRPSAALFLDSGRWRLSGAVASPSSEPGEKRQRGAGSRLGEAACAGPGRCGDPGQGASGFKMSAALWSF